MPSRNSLSSVRFQNVEIRVYGIDLGDNPSCSQGPPISLGWEYDKDSKQINLDEYENHREGVRRTSNQMKIPAFLREEMLRVDSSITDVEINNIQKKCKEIQRQRSRTIIQLERKDNMKQCLKKVIYFGMK